MSHRYLLDTDHVSYALRGHGRVGQTLLSHKPSEVCISVITVAELRYGAEKRSSKKLHALIDTFLSNVDVMAFDAEAANEYGKLAAKLGKRGTPIGQLDTLIAGHAMALGLCLVSNNQRHFSRIRGLKLDNWV